MNEMRKLMEAVSQLDEAYQGSKTEHSGAGRVTTDEETYRGLPLPRDYRTNNIVIMPEKSGGVEIYGDSEWLEDGVAFSKAEWEDLISLIKRHNL